MDRSASVISAGVLDIAIRYRDDILGDVGVSIQVFAKIAGQATQLLRFDCFANSPHYHYGVGTGSERLFLDVTAEGDPLQWTLERFQRGRLRAMIERAGYSAVADALDEELFQSILPELARQAQALVREHVLSSPAATHARTMGS